MNRTTNPEWPVYSEPTFRMYEPEVGTAPNGKMAIF